jgi:hypothetical protein
MYYGWNPDAAQMQMMQLPEYLDAFRLSYERALEDLQGQVATLTQMYAPTGYAPPGPPQRWRGRGGRSEQHGHHKHEHEHDHDHHHDHDCGCGHRDDCRCDCCIVDADYIVYARCFERRVVPIQIENDTRKVREDVELEVSDVRSSGGRVLPWKVAARPGSPLTLAPCSTTEIDLIVDIRCGDDTDDDGKPATPRKATAQKATAARAQEEAAATRGTLELQDVDDCEVGYVTVRVGGCLIRPIVVAIAVLPRDCDAYHAGCSCSCC